MPTIEEVNIKVENTIEDVKELKKRVESIEHYKEENRLSMQNIERDVSDVKDDVSDVKNSVEKIFAKLDKISDSLKKDTDEHFKNLEDKNNELSAKIEKLENKEDEKKLKVYNSIADFIKKGMSSMVGKIVFSVPFLYGLYELVVKIIESLKG